MKNLYGWPASDLRISHEIFSTQQKYQSKYSVFILSLQM